MTATFQSTGDEVKIIITPGPGDAAQLQKFCDGGFLIAVPHFFASQKVCCVTVESMNRMPEKPRTARHAE